MAFPYSIGKGDGRNESSHSSRVIQTKKW